LGDLHKSGILYKCFRSCSKPVGEHMLESWMEHQKEQAKSFRRRFKTHRRVEGGEIRTKGCQASRKQPQEKREASVRTVAPAGETEGVVVSACQ